jgi:uncharacterized radical SAM superfamily Fe-S cluster-containing enzyme
MPERPYTYFDFTVSLCSECLQRVDAKIILQDNDVFMIKRCPQHVYQKILIATDAQYYTRARQYVKPSGMPLKFNTETIYGCPYDCGLCPDHEQHSCLTLLEITDRCNLSCPTCYASSSPSYGKHRTLDEIDFMLKAIVENEGQPDVVQISGGEPTMHPKFFEIIEKCRAQPIRHLMVNTNGTRIATEPDFAAKLAKYRENFEIYLQFDSFKQSALEHLRGVDLRNTRLSALEQLNRHNISTTLVVTLQKGVNEDEIGAIIDFALKQDCVRGVTFQPTQFAGRLEQVDPNQHRYTLTEIRQAILTQSSVFSPEDIIPVPCNPDALAMGYALKWQGKVLPLTHLIDPDDLIRQGRNTIVYEQDDIFSGCTTSAAWSFRTRCKQYQTGSNEP